MKRLLNTLTLLTVTLAITGCGTLQLEDPNRYGRTEYDVCIRCGDEPVWINRDYVGNDGDLSDVYPR